MTVAWFCVLRARRSSGRRNRRARGNRGRPPRGPNRCPVDYHLSEPSSRIDAECTGTTCRLRLAFRKPGTAEGTWDHEEELALDLADFDAVWSVIERSHLAQLEPRPTTAPSPVHPGKWRWRFELERMTGERVEIDRSWESPSSADTVGASFLLAAGKLAQRLAQTVPVRYFPAP